MKELLIQNIPHVVDLLVLLGGYGCILVHRWVTLRRVCKGSTVSRVAHVLHGLVEVADKEEK